MSWANSYFIPIYNDIQINDKLFYTQADIIKEVAKEPCIIVGRCADYILRDEENVINVFLHAN
ncbi:cytidylate kinase-like family protein, partial [Lactococcus formosensis]